jgi:tRNA A22 N-methylase
MCPERDVIVDVGADHGYVAQRLGGIATERQPHRRGKTSGPWVIADGLMPFKGVEVAIVAGMGAQKISDILNAGAPVPTVIVHATDSPAKLRLFLAAAGWVIKDEALAPEGRAFAEIIRAERGHETHQELTLAFGPILTQTRGPHHLAHFSFQLRRWQDIAQAASPFDPGRTRKAMERVAFLTQLVAQLSA